MSGERKLAVILRTMAPILHSETFVFTTLPNHVVPDGLNEVMRFREAEGTTLILPEVTAHNAGLEYEYRCRMITLNVHSSLEAVGFIAKIANALAKEDMGVNPVSGFYHDHLFVPLERAQDALDIIEELRTAARSQGN